MTHGGLYKAEQGKSRGTGGEYPCPEGHSALATKARCIGPSSRFPGLRGQPHVRYGGPSGWHSPGHSEYKRPGVATKSPLCRRGGPGFLNMSEIFLLPPVDFLLGGFIAREFVLSPFSERRDGTVSDVSRSTQPPGRPILFNIGRLVGTIGSESLGPWETTMGRAFAPLRATTVKVPSRLSLSWQPSCIWLFNISQNNNVHRSNLQETNDSPCC